MNSVKFGDKDSYKDWGLILKPKSRPLPTPKTNYISIEGKDGDLDLTTSLTGDVKYNNLSFSLEFTLMNKRDDWEEKLYEITTYLQGKKMKVVFSEDPEWYYVGRMTLDGISNNKNVGIIKINCNVEPYRLKADETIINEPIVAGKEILLPNSRKWVMPTIEMYHENIIPITATSKTIEGVEFAKNENDSITINGTATNDLEYEISNDDFTLEKNIEYHLAKPIFEETLTGNEIYIPNGIEGKAKGLSIDGRSTQETTTDNLFNNTWEQGGIGSEDGVAFSNSTSIMSDYIEVLPNYLYTLSRTVNTSYMTFRFYDKDKNYLGYQTTEGMMTSSQTSNRMPAETSQMTFTISNQNVKYMRIVDNSNDLSTIYMMTTNCPSPDYPSEIESVGYENLFDKDNPNILNALLTSSTITLNSSSSEKTLIFKVDNNATYTIQKAVGKRLRVAEFTDLPVIGSTGFNIKLKESSDSITYTTTTGNYIAIGFYVSTDEITLEEMLESIMIEKASTAHSYIPYGKYRIEIKTVGKNLFNKNNASYTSYNGVWCDLDNYIPIKNNTSYTLQGIIVPESWTLNIYLYDNKKNKIDTLSIINTNHNIFHFTLSNNNARYIKFNLRSNIIDFSTIQLEQSSSATEYEEYKENTSVIVLNEPLRSLPNGVKDIAYIKNNKLYVDRYVGSVVLDGSETISLQGQSTTGYNRYLIKKTLNNKIEPKKNVKSNVFCDYFVPLSNDNQYDGKEGILLRVNYQDQILILDESFSTIADVKNFLIENNTQVDYELATPVTEEYDLPIIQIYDGANNISNSEETNMTITYSRGICFKMYGSDGTLIYSGVGGAFSFTENKTISKVVISMLDGETINDITTYPKIELDEDANVNFVFEGKEFALSGVVRTPDILLKEGGSKIVLKRGLGNIKISYREGKL